MKTSARDKVLMMIMPTLIIVLFYGLYVGMNRQKLVARLTRIPHGVSIDARLLAETLLAMAELLPEDTRRVTCFYGAGELLGFCARNSATAWHVLGTADLAPPGAISNTLENEP